MPFLDKGSGVHSDIKDSDIVEVLTEPPGIDDRTRQCLRRWHCSVDQTDHQEQRGRRTYSDPPGKAHKRRLGAQCIEVPRGAWRTHGPSPCPALMRSVGGGRRKATSSERRGPSSGPHPPGRKRAISPPERFLSRGGATTSSSRRVMAQTHPVNDPLRLNVHDLRCARTRLICTIRSISRSSSRRVAHSAREIAANDDRHCAYAERSPLMARSMSADSSLSDRREDCMWSLLFRCRRHSS